MAFTYSLATDIGRCRLRFPDRDSATPYFQDDEWASFLLTGGTIWYALVEATIAVGQDDNMSLRYTQSLGLTVDGTKAAEVMIKLADKRLAHAEKMEAAAGGGAWDVGEWVVDDFSYREKLLADALQEG